MELRCGLRRERGAIARCGLFLRVRGRELLDMKCTGILNHLRKLQSSSSGK